MLRRIPYIKITSNEVIYICPQCKKEIPRDLYLMIEDCPTCNSSLNKTCKTMLKVYKEVDVDLYKHFIQLLRR